MQHRLTIDNDLLASHNLVEELDKLLSPFGINLEIENEEHDGFDVCIVTLPEEGHRRIVLVARAASGKDFLRNKLTARNMKPSISITTRPPRPGEVDGKDYIFITEAKAEQMIENDEFYEYVRFNSWLYGTTKQQFKEDDVFIMTPAGISKIKPEDRKNCFIIFLDIPEEVRRERLAQRKMPGDTIDRRIVADEEDFRNFKDYDMRVTNPDF